MVDPDGWAAIVTDRFPRVLGRILVIGGVGHLLGSLVGHKPDDAPGALVDVLTVPAGW
ncbi:MAG: hypothetical protein ACKVZ6_04930 [Kineosporiaceae bacterium]